MANVFIIQRNILMLIDLNSNLLAVEIAVAPKRSGKLEILPRLTSVEIRVN
jgi:hypothetical protein